MLVFGEQIKCKPNPCDKDGKKQGVKIDDYVNLYVRLTNTCQAKCSFCEFNGKDEKVDCCVAIFGICGNGKKIKLT